MAIAFRPLQTRLIFAKQAHFRAPVINDKTVE